MFNVSDLMITSLETIKAYSVDGTTHRFTLDELQEVTIANTQDKNDITGKGGRKIGSIKRNKGVTITGNNGMVSSGLLEAQTGSRFETKADAVIDWTDYPVTKLVGADVVAYTEFHAAGVAGAEIICLYLKNPDGTAGTQFKQVVVGSGHPAILDGEFTYDPATKTLKFKTGDTAFNGQTEGIELIVSYQRKIAASVLSNESDVYSETLRLYIDAFAEDRCGTIYRVQFFIPKADFNGQFDFQMSDTQSVHAFEAESLAGACGTAGQLWTYTIFGKDAEDYSAPSTMSLDDGE